MIKNDNFEKLDLKFFHVGFLCFFVEQEINHFLTAFSHNLTLAINTDSFVVPIIIR